MEIGQTAATTFWDGICVNRTNRGTSTAPLTKITKQKPNTCSRGSSKNQLHGKLFLFLHFRSQNIARNVNRNRAYCPVAWYHDTFTNIFVSLLLSASDKSGEAFVWLLLLWQAHLLLLLFYVVWKSKQTTPLGL